MVFTIGPGSVLYFAATTVSTIPTTLPLTQLTAILPSTLNAGPFVLNGKLGYTWGNIVNNSANTQTLT